MVVARFIVHASEHDGGSSGNDENGRIMMVVVAMFMVHDTVDH